MDTIRAALVGKGREKHVFALTQSLELCDFYKAHIEACDRRLEAAVAALTVWAGSDLAPLPKARIKGKQHNAPSFDVRAAIYGVLGVSRSGFHAWRSRPIIQRAAHDTKLVQAMDKSYKVSDRSYGARRVWHDLLEDGLACGLNRIERLMRLERVAPIPIHIPMRLDL